MSVCYIFAENIYKPSLYVRGHEIRRYEIVEFKEFV